MGIEQGRQVPRTTGGLRRALLAAASVAVLATAGAGMAQAADTPAATPPPPPPAWGQRHGGHWKGHGDPAARMARELNLTDAQRQQVRDIFQKSHAEGQALRTKMDEMHKEIHALVTSGKYTDEQARAIATKYEPVFVDMTVHATRTMNEVRAVLTPEQRAKADAMAGKWGRHGGGYMMGPPPGGPPPGPPAG